MTGHYRFMHSSAVVEAPRAHLARIVTLGLASLLINALLFLVAASLVGVQTGSFLNVFVAALIVSLIGWAISIFVKT